MTRWARKGPKNKKNPLPSSSWSDLKDAKVDTDNGEQIKTNDQIQVDKERSDYRRQKRIESRQNQKVCYNCRELGHKMSECTKSKDDWMGTTGICFKCGSTEHALSKCSIRLSDNKLPFAKCFICQQVGHLSRDCPSNPKGLYPNGGCCNTCGSIKHLNRDCPERKKSKRKNEDTESKITFLKMLDNKTSLDEDTTFNHATKIIPSKKIKKVITF